MHSPIYLRWYMVALLTFQPKCATGLLDSNFVSLSAAHESKFHYIIFSAEAELSFESA